jgi:hypothetical protein
VYTDGSCKLDLPRQKTALNTDAYTRSRHRERERKQLESAHRGKQGLHTGPATKTQKATRAREEEGSTKNERGSERVSKREATAARHMRTRRRICWRCPWNLPEPGTPWPDPTRPDVQSPFLSFCLWFFSLWEGNA